MAMTNKGSTMIMSQIAALRALQGHEVQVGWFASDRYPAEKGQTVGIPVAKIARLQEFGGSIEHPGGTAYIPDAIVKNKAVGARFVTKLFPGSFSLTGAHTINIPARPFMRQAYANFQLNAAKLQQKVIGKLINGQLTAQQALNQIGMELENQIVKSIKTGQWTPNAASTIKKKGFDKPLVESGHLWQTVNSKVI